MVSPALTLVVETSVPPEPESVRSLTATEVEPPEEPNPLPTTPPTPPPTRAAGAEAAGGGFFLLGRLAVSLPPLEEAWFWLSAAFPPVQFRAGVVIGTMIQVGLGIAIVIGILVKVHQSSLLCC